MRPPTPCAHPQSSTAKNATRENAVSRCAGAALLVAAFPEFLDFDRERGRMEILNAGGGPAKQKRRQPGELWEPRSR
jgi:hypothetical protein